MGRDKRPVSLSDGQSGHNVAPPAQHWVHYVMCRRWGLEGQGEKMHSQGEAEGDPEHNSAGAGGCCFPGNPGSPPKSSASLLPRPHASTHASPSEERKPQSKPAIKDGSLLPHFSVLKTKAECRKLDLECKAEFPQPQARPPSLQGLSSRSRNVFWFCKGQGWAGSVPVRPQQLGLYTPGWLSAKCRL